MPNVGDYIAQYLFDIYTADERMQKFAQHPAACFSKLTDRSIIATLNATQKTFADNGYRFYEYIREGTLHTREMNYNVNFEWLFTEKIDGKKDYFYAGEKFRNLVLEQYGLQKETGMKDMRSYGR